MNSITTFVLAFLLITASFSYAARPGGDSKDKKAHKGDGDEGGYGGYFGPGGGFNIPEFRNGIIRGGGGYGGGYGGPSGGYGKGGIISPTVVCKEKGPCYQKKLRCPAKCFTSYSRSGKGLGRVLQAYSGGLHRW